MVVSQPWHALERNDQDLVDVEVHDKQLFLEYVLMIATLRKQKKKKKYIHNYFNTTLLHNTPYKTKKRRD